MSRLSLAVAAGSAALAATALFAAGRGRLPRPRRPRTTRASAPVPRRTAGHAACLARVVTTQRAPDGAQGRPERDAVRLRPGRHPVGLQPRQRVGRRAAPSRSSTPTTTRTPRPTSASTARSTACRPARRRTAASARSTRPAAPRYPRTNAGWATEISLDLDMVSAACPDCKILLVEAKSASFTNLGHRRELRRHPGRVGDQQQLRRQRQHRVQRVQPPGHRDHRVDR